MSNIRGKNLTAYLTTITDVTSICEVFHELPLWSQPVNTYLYPQKVTEEIINYNNTWPQLKRATIAITVVCKKDIDRAWLGEFPEDVILSVFDAIDLNIVSKNCFYVDDIDWIAIAWISEGSMSPMWYTIDRPTMQKQYLVTYNAK